ncbi:MAG TPA: M3 family oligoendopeptidase [Steroidobacteraceae bacterium]|nr:M3 family oligoendopeptidase [Steroidobacteraceae bacterium]
MHRTFLRPAVTALVVGALASGSFGGAAAATADTPAPAPAATTAATHSGWDLTDLYQNPEAWSAAFARTKDAADMLERYKGTLGQSPQALLSALDAASAVNRETSRLFVYANLKADEDLHIAANQERRQQAQTLATLLDERTAWMAPEILALGADKVRADIGANHELARRFDFFLNDTLRAAPHTLGTEAENVLASAGEVLRQPDTVRGLLADGDLPYPTVELSGGVKIRLDTSGYSRARQLPNRADRKQAFNAFWGMWKNYQGTLGGLLAAQVMGNEFQAQTRKFSSALESAQFSYNMPASVYRTLVAEAHAGLPTLHRYLRLRQRQLGISGPLEYYDNYPPIFALHPEPKFTLTESERITLAALQPLGKDYLKLLQRGFAGRWMDPEPHAGKASSSYMSGAAYDVHPYLLLHFTGDFESLSTLAHEWGHAVHTLLADAAQPFEKSNYSIFIAETASIGNEMLLNDYMVAHAKSKAEKLYYLGQGLESIRTTFFRQVQFAEFELQIHQEFEQGHALSGARMTQMYCDLLRHYYGDAEGVMHIDPAYCVEWAFVPHFYYDFYVYQYATSMAGAAYMTDAILKQGAPARERFIAVLRAGGSDYPYELYKRAGIDMAQPAPYRALMARMNRIMDEIEALQRKP